jgi:hypothetical protein
MVLPLVQTIVDFAGALGATGAVEVCATGVELADGDATGAGASWVSFTFTVGEENVNPLADRYNQPLFSFTEVEVT